MLPLSKPSLADENAPPIAAILVDRIEQVFFPLDTVGARQIVVEAGILGVHAGFGQRVRHIPPADPRIGLRRLVRLLPSARREKRTRWCAAAARWHVAFGHLVEHGRQHIGEEPELLDPPQRQRQCDRNRLLGPAGCTRSAAQADGGMDGLLPRGQEDSPAGDRLTPCLSGAIVRRLSRGRLPIHRH